MCGITGYISKTKIANKFEVLKMANTISKRGPDSFGYWCDKKLGIAIAHRRLSIIDTSSAGHQPMISKNNRYIISFNGEIYNYKDLKKEISSSGFEMQWEGNSDTEVLLAQIQIYGVFNTLKKINGMFAISVWDKEERKLILARDRIGEKPLYYGINKGNFLFASELKAIKEFEDSELIIDKNSLCSFLRHAYIPSPHCIYQGFKKLSPGEYVEFNYEKFELSDPIEYWSLSHYANLKNKKNIESNSTDLYINELNKKLIKSVKSRMMSDVPIGAFLSGGIDSSLVVSIMQSLSIKPINTFTIGFNNESYNEAESAKEISNFLGTNHTELYVTPNQTLNVIDKLPDIWDEPFADSSQIPTFFLSELTSRKVKVALSGDGGDELFCGYNRYSQGYLLYKFLRKFPYKLRKIISKSIKSINPIYINQLMSTIPKKYQYKAAGDRLHKLADVINYSNDFEFYKFLISSFKSPKDYLISGEEPKNLFSEPNNWPETSDFRELMMYLDMKTYLPEDILTKVDRATMTNSLEARVPFLDHELVEWVWSLPFNLKLRDGKSKWILKEVLSKYIPRNLTERPKSGFGIPIEYWLNGPLREWSESLLSKYSIEKQSLFNHKKVTKLWEDHKSGKVRAHYQLWSILMATAWAERNT